MTIQSTASDKTILAELGKRLAVYRLQQNLTQEDLAREAGIGLNTVYRIERGHSIQLSNLIRLMRVLEIADNIEQLLPVLPSSPVQQAKLKNAQRQRASALKDKTRRTTVWQWGDQS